MKTYEGRQLNKTDEDYIEQRNARRLLGIVTDGQLIYYPSPFGKSMNVISYSIELKNILGEYKTELEAKKALETVIRAVASEEKIVMTPDENQLKALLYRHTEVWHHATEKKTKGHGGS